ncbi:phospholipid-transporting ATPase ABCA1-like [Ruditapes philippinarum]|uniref:phospholipid-transporting ATPase ABCA1-like n=1 Tax=Ruditapes philippinarum TaxID=129788 RepID=UPI00295BBA8C|nr:phospholipid-transporting ATPase ABCA1-like [Ruditapes philippinarum]
MIAVDTVVYFILAWYIDNVHPGSYGIPKPWYFPFTSSYWCGTSLWETCCLKRLLGINRSRRRYYLVNDDPENDDVTVDDDSGISDLSLSFGVISLSIILGIYIDITYIKINQCLVIT